MIGIDPSVDHPAFAIWPSCETWQFQTEGEGAERLRLLYSVAHEWTIAEAPEDLEAVFIERATGRFASPVLTQANGVIQVAVLHALNPRFDYPAMCFELSPGSWKRTALGKGNAKKQDVLKWALDQPATKPVMTQDEADALAIACAGHRLLREP